MRNQNRKGRGILRGDGLRMTADTEEEGALSQMQTLADHVGYQHVHHAPIAADANKVPGFPQDAFMDMGMDEVVAKPQNNGLPRNWSAMVMGMVTRGRDTTPDLYELVMNHVR